MTFAEKLITAMSIVLGMYGVARRLYPKANSVNSFLALGIPMGVVLAVDLGTSYGWASSRTFVGIAAYAFFCELFIFLFTLVMGSISASLLIAAASGHSGSIVRSSNDSMMVIQRLIALEGNGLVEENDGSYGITPKGRCLMVIMEAMRRFFGHEDPS